jgi:hypothetical protein
VSGPPTVVLPPVPQPRIAVVRRDLAWLLRYAPDLGGARVPGTRRHWTQPGRGDPEQRRRRELEAAADLAARRAHGMAAIGASPAPLRLDASEALVDVLATVEQLTDRAAQSLGRDRPPPAQSAFADPAPYLQLLHDLAGLLATDPQPEARALFHDLAGDAARLCRTVARVLGMVEDGLVLDADCPWCRQSRVLRYTVDEHHAERCDRTCQAPWWSGDVPLASCWRDALIVCTSGVCEPRDADREALWRGLPAWSVARSGEWLMARIRHDEATVVA